jgi:hypothetical protein
MTARNGSEAAALNAHQEIAFDILAPFSTLKSCGRTKGIV